MKSDKSIIRFLIPAVILFAVSLQNCMNVPRDNAADKYGDKYNVAFSEKAIKSFVFSASAYSTIFTSDISGTITDTDIAVYVARGTDTRQLVATFEISGPGSVYINNVEQVSGLTPNNFTSPLTYTVEALDGTTRDYIIKIVETVIDSFSIVSPSITGIIDESNNNNPAINAVVPYYTDVTSLVAKFTADSGLTITAGAILQSSEVTANNFSLPLSYIVTAPTGVMRMYTVTVSFGSLNVHHLAGPLGGPGQADGIGINARFGLPYHIITDGINFYVVDKDNNTILSRKLQLKSYRIKKRVDKKYPWQFSEG